MTADELTRAIANAIRAGDEEAIETLFRALVKVDWHRAEEVYETMRLGVAIARQFEWSEGGP